MVVCSAEEGSVAGRKVVARREIGGGEGSCNRKSARSVSGAKKKKIQATVTCKSSRLIFSRDFAFTPPSTMLARQSNRTTTRISAPCAIMSSIAVICTLVSERASKSGNACVI